MLARRHRPATSITTVPRSTVAHVHHKEIDAILKDLRTCSRRLRSALDSFRDELQTLERLYYKCKNQHRMSLFFKRVSELRRYGRRLSELDVLERVDLLRAAFVGLEHTNDQKALRSTWSRAPEGPYVRFLTERLTACSTLVCKMRERLEKAYRHFALAMQTGAFVQFIILFVAISSRMFVLSSELEEALRLSISTCNRLLLVIHPTDMHSAIPRQSPSEPEMARVSDAERDVPSDDTGQPIPRREPIDILTAPVVEDSSMKTEATSEARVVPLPSHPTNAAGHGTPQTSKTVTVKARTRKTKKKFDEIDEIFGF